MKIINAPPSQYALPPNAPLPPLKKGKNYKGKEQNQTNKKKKKKKKQRKKGEVVREVNDGHEQPLF